MIYSFILVEIYVLLLFFKIPPTVKSYYRIILLPDVDVIGYSLLLILVITVLLLVLYRS